MKVISIANSQDNNTAYNRENQTKDPKAGRKHKDHIPEVKKTKALISGGTHRELVN